METLVCLGFGGEHPWFNVDDYESPVTSDKKEIGEMAAEHSLVPSNEPHRLGDDPHDLRVEVCEPETSEFKLTLIGDMPAGCGGPEQSRAVPLVLVAADSSNRPAS